MYYIDDFHFYPIVDDKIRRWLCKSYSERDDTATKVIGKEEAKKKEVADLKEMERFVNYKAEVDVWDINELDKLKQCHVYYHSGNLKPLLIELLKVKGKEYLHNSPREAVTRIQYDNDVWLYANPNHKANTDWNASIRVCKKLDIPFRMQSVSAAATEFVNVFHNPKGKQQKRKDIPARLKVQIRREQRERCNGSECNVELKTGGEFNHIQSVANGGLNVRSNLELLCKECHAQVSSEQAATKLIDMDATCSYYNQESMQVFATETPKNAILHNPLDKDFFLNDDGSIKKKWLLAGLDNRKCRRNMVRYANQDEWCVFTFLDCPEPFNAEKHGDIPRGFYFVEPSNPQICPMRGNGWYSVPMIKYCLKKKLIKLNEIKAVIKSTLKLKHNYYHKFIDALINAFPDDKDEWLLKLCFNGWVGMLGSRKIKNRKMRVFNERATAEAGAFEEVKEGQHFTVTPKFWPTALLVGEEDPRHGLDLKPQDSDLDSADYFEATWFTDKFKMESHMPIFMQILDLEAIYLHKMSEEIVDCGGIPCHYNTDCVMGLFTDESQLKKLQKIAEKSYWDEEDTVLKYKFIDCTDGKKVFNFDRKDIPSREQVYIPEWKWMVIPDPCTNNFKTWASYMIKYLRGFLLTAPPGCGKTYLAQEILRQLNGKDYDPKNGQHKQYICNLATGLTHQARKLLGDGARTLHSALSCLRHGGGFHRLKKYKYLIVDEVSMANSAMLMLIGRIKQANPEIRICLIGDFKQLKPINDIVGKGFDYEGSYGVWWICDGTRVELTQNRRVVDKDSNKLVDMFMNPDKVDRSLFPTKECERSISYTNRKRKW
jgi:hypothetical protein